MLWFPVSRTVVHHDRGSLGHDVVAQERAERRTAWRLGSNRLGPLQLPGMHRGKGWIKKKHSWRRDRLRLGFIVCNPLSFLHARGGN